MYIPGLGDSYIKRTGLLVMPFRGLACDFHSPLRVFSFRGFSTGAFSGTLQGIEPKLVTEYVLF